MTGAIFAQTSATTLTELQSRLPVAFGASSYATLTAALPNPGWAVTASGDFTLDQAVSLSGADGLSLHAAGSLEIDAPVSIGGGGAVSLASDTSWGLVGAGKIDFGGVDQGATLSINGSSYTLIYDGDLASVRAAGDYALATDETAPSTAYRRAVISSFGGTFEGLGNALTGLTIDSTGANAALFGRLASGGTIRDLALVDASISGAQQAAALVGANSGSVIDVTVSGTILGGANTGGVVGVNEPNASLVEVKADVSVTGTTSVGGLIGRNLGSVALAFVNGEQISGGENVGGLIGYNQGALAASTDTGGVSGTSAVGGLIGFNTATGTIDSVNETGGTVDGVANVGGIAGVNAGQIGAGVQIAGFADTARDAVIGTGSGVGGLVGLNIGGLTAFFATGPVQGVSIVGGAVGVNTGALSDVSISGEVDGGAFTGGLVGKNTGSIISGTVTSSLISGTSAVGGLVGLNRSQAAVSGEVSGGTVRGAKIVGGLVGSNAQGVISASSNSDVVIATGNSVGGLAGANAGTITTSANTGAVSGGDQRRRGGRL